jgi:hypothetical protein
MQKAARRAARMQALIEALEEASAILEAYHYPIWAHWFADGARRLRAGDRHALAHVRQAYGGMGSFTDVVLDGPDGERLDELRATIFALVQALR